MSAKDDYVDLVRQDMQQTIDRLRAALAEIREIYAGMEGPIMPETAPEAYLQRIIESMWKAAREALLQEADDEV